MRECITILNGQAGIQIGDVCWDIYRLEHGIQPDGKRMELKNRNENELLDMLFNESSYHGHYIPRSVMVDHDPSVIDYILSGPKGKLYSSRMTVTGSEDAANNFSRGFYTLSPKILEPTIDVIRKSMELCDSFQGFLMFSSFGGGTGSGFSARLIDELETCFGKKNRLEFNVFPSPRMSTAIVEPYNAVFRAHTSLIYSSCMFLFDNEACYDICRRQLDVERAHHHHINQLISQVASSITASTRFGGSLNVDLVEFETNLVPFPRIHFPSASYAPVLNRNKSVCQTMSAKEITRSCFASENQLIKYSPAQGKYISCCLLYRGDVTPKEVNAAMVDLKATSREPIKFVNWSPTGLKTGIASEPPAMDGDIAQPNRAVCLLSNNTGMVECWRLLAQKFDLMFNKRAFVHWYVSEGMEEGEFVEAREDIAYLIKDYDELAESGSIDESRYSITSLSLTEQKSKVMNGNFDNHPASDNILPDE